MKANGCQNGSPHRRPQALLLSVAGAAILASLPFSAATAMEYAPTSGLLLSDMRPVPDAVLANNRGGFRVGRLDISFGISVSTSIRGPDINPFTVTTNFTVDHPGDIKTVGSEISQSVANTGSSSSHSAVTTPQGSSPSTTFSVQLGPNSFSPTGSSGHQSSDSTVAQNVPPPASNTQSTQTTQHSSDAVVQSIPSTSTANDASPPPIPAVTKTEVASSPTPASTPTPTLTSAATPTPPSNSASNFVASVDPATNSVTVTNNVGTNVVVNAGTGILTTIKNNIGGLTFTSKVDLNYAINNYHDALTNAQAFMQAASIADQMLAIHGFSGH